MPVLNIFHYKQCSCNLVYTEYNVWFIDKEANSWNGAFYRRQNQIPSNMIIAKVSLHIRNMYDSQAVQLFHDGGFYHIEPIDLQSKSNQCTGF